MAEMQGAHSELQSAYNVSEETLLNKTAEQEAFAKEFSFLQLSSTKWETEARSLIGSYAGLSLDPPWTRQHFLVP